MGNKGAKLNKKIILNKKDVKFLVKQTGHTEDEIKEVLSNIQLSNKSYFKFLKILLFFLLLFRFILNSLITTQMVTWTKLNLFVCIWSLNQNQMIN
jgi:hypothetical protein